MGLMWHLGAQVTNLREWLLVGWNMRLMSRKGCLLAVDEGLVGWKERLVRRKGCLLALD